MTTIPTDALLFLRRTCGESRTKSASFLLFFLSLEEDEEGILGEGERISMRILVCMLLSMVGVATIDLVDGSSSGNCMFTTAHGRLAPCCSDFMLLDCCTGIEGSNFVSFDVASPAIRPRPPTVVRSFPNSCPSALLLVHVANCLQLLLFPSPIFYKISCLFLIMSSLLRSL